MLIPVAIALLTLVHPPLSEAAQKELKKLEGKWKVVKMADSTKEAEANPNDPMALFVFKGTELTLEYGEKKEVIRVSAVDPTTDPKCIDLAEKRRDNTERTLEGVYKLDGESLQIALYVPKDAKQRPTGFDKPTDPRVVVWTMKRVKD